MSFGKFGKISYASDTKVQDFIRFLEQGKIMASKCKSCKRVYFPPRSDCDCMSGETEWIELSGDCKLVTWTTVHFAPASFRNDVPYVLAVAQFEEGPTVFASLSKEIMENEIQIGMNLKLMPIQLPSDRIIYELTKR